MFRAEPPPQKQRPAPSALLEARFRNVEFYKPNKVFQLLGRGLVAWVGALAVGRARGSPSGCVWAGSSTGCRLTPLRTLAGEEVACPGWSGGHGQRTGAASAPSLGRGSRPPSPHPGSPPRHLKGPGPQSAQSTAGLCSGPKHGPPLASAGMHARPHTKLTPPGTNTPSGRGCQRRYAESSPSLAWLTQTWEVSS